MPSLLDYAESILRLEIQAIEQAERGNLEGLRAAKQSLLAIMKDCGEACTRFPDAAVEDREWLQRKYDKAAAALV